MHDAPPVPMPTVKLFPDGSLGITLAGQGMHFDPQQAATLFDVARQANFIPTGANAHQVGGDHYRSQPVQVWDAIVAWELGFLDGNIVKYVARYRRKGGLEDLLKAKHYLDKLIEVEGRP